MDRCHIIQALVTLFVVVEGPGENLGRFTKADAYYFEEMRNHFLNEIGETAAIPIKGELSMQHAGIFT